MKHIWRRKKKKFKKMHNNGDEQKFQGYLYNDPQPKVYILVEIKFLHIK